MIIKSRGKLKDGYNREHILSVEKQTSLITKLNI